MTMQPNIPANLHLVADPAQGPRYQHDCAYCHFLGRFVGCRGEVDLYVHALGNGATVIARFGDNASDRASGMSFSYGAANDLSEARTRAQTLGLLEYRPYDAMYYAKPGTKEFAELQRALPLTVEHRAFLAHEQGDDAQSQALLRHLVQQNLTWGIKCSQAESSTTAVLAIEFRLGKVLDASAGLSCARVNNGSRAMMEMLRADVLVQESTKAKARFSV